MRLLFDAQTGYTLEHAANVFPQFSVSDLRNYIKRGYLKHVGDVPLAAQKRRFDLFGLFEIGLIAALNHNGFSLAQSAKQVDMIILSAKGSFEMDPEHPEKCDPSPSVKAACHAFGKAFRALSNQNTSQEPPDTSDSVLWIFLPEQIADLSPYRWVEANGWKGIDSAIKILYHSIATGELVGFNGVPENSAWRSEQSRFPLLHLFNLSAALENVVATISSQLMESADITRRGGEES